ncbi:MAG: DUF1501 domain-containing protein [Phycisphaerales bacterium]|nr:DUF1501 domain-containing protein [Phycisphaerales bacterium]
MERELDLMMTRRQLFGKAATGIGAAALASIFGSGAAQASPHFAPRAKRVIYLFMSGGPSQLDLFDYKPRLHEQQGIDLPDSVRMGQRITGMTSGQATLPVASSKFTFARRGESGAWVSSLMPHTASIVDDVAFVRSVHTEAINHDPAITFIQSGHQQPGRPSLGAWLSYGLGSEADDLPAFVVLISHGSSKRDAQPLFDRLWGSGFLPSNHQGVKFRGSGDPVLYLNDPPGVDRDRRRRVIDGVNALNRIALDTFHDPEINTRIQAYEMAYRMQSSVPDLQDLSDEPESIMRLYGDQARVPGTFASNCLLARRMLERGCRFVQLFHRGWDQHFNLPGDHTLQCRDVDQPSAALVKDLKQRGMLDDTLVIWGGEFGRTVYCQGELTTANYGRDHHGRCFTVWMAGGGIKGGIVHGETDDFSYNIVRDPVHIHDLNATILHCPGLNHERLTFPHQGRDFRLTDVHGNVVKALLA